MKLRLLTILAIGLISSNAAALDFELRVLAIRTSNAVLDDEMEQQSIRFAEIWANSQGITSPITITIVNDDILPLALSIPELTGGSLWGPGAPGGLQNDAFQAQWQEAQNETRNLLALRNQHAADLVIIYTNKLTAYSGLIGSEVCGYAPMNYWTDDPVIENGLPVPKGFLGVGTPPLGVDLRGKESYYIAMVSTNIACTSQLNLVAHELGHLFGGGHDTDPLPPGFPATFYLFPDSHAMTGITWIPFVGQIGFKTALARVNSDIDSCNNSVRGTCILGLTYSDPPGWGDITHDNVRTLNTTGLSVANYREPGCGLSKPDSVVGAFLFCNGSGAVHVMDWDDSCPAATDFYEVWFSFNGFNYFFGAAPEERTIVFTTNPSSFNIVRACDSSTCSAFSGAYFAIDNCE